MKKKMILFGRGDFEKLPLKRQVSSRYWVLLLWMIRLLRKLNEKSPRPLLASEGRPVNHQVDHLPHNSLQWKYYHSISAHIRVWLLLWKKNVHLGLFLWKTTILRRNHVSDINEIGRFLMITKLVHMIRRVILEMEEIF